MRKFPVCSALAFAIIAGGISSSAQAQTQKGDAIKVLTTFDARLEAGISYRDFPAVTGQAYAALNALEGASPEVQARIAAFKARNSSAILVWRIKVDDGFDFVARGDLPVQKMISRQCRGPAKPDVHTPLTQVPKWD